MSHKPIAVLGVLIGILLVQACGRPIEPEQSCNFVQNSRAQRVSWSGNTPATFFIDSSVPEKFRATILAAAETWNQTVGHKVLEVRLSDGGGSDTPRKDGVSKIYFLNTWDADRTTEQARTTVYWAGSRLYEADIRINDKDFDFYVDTNDEAFTYTASASREVHFQSLILHELGHALGLAHNENKDSVMRAALASHKVRDVVYDVDKESLSCEY